jgi:hypothetical protein
LGIGNWGFLQRWSAQNASTTLAKNMFFVYKEKNS